LQIHPLRRFTPIAFESISEYQELKYLLSLL
jgi:hypothetical protein